MLQKIEIKIEIDIYHKMTKFVAKEIIERR
jgi:hypothetical protein